MLKHKDATNNNRAPILNGFLLVAIVITRLIQYLFKRSLWLDEAALALNVVARDFRGLLQPLDNNQAAPIGFLLISKLNISLFGNNEYSLRLYPLLMGIVAAFLVYVLVQRLAPKATPFVLLLFATSNIFIYYSSEFKQYSSDATFALLIWSIAALYSENYKTQHLILWGVVGIVGVWFSHPIVFVIAGVGLVMLFDRLRQRDWQALGQVVVACLLPAISFIIAYLSFYQYIVRNSELADAMQTYWGNQFLVPTLFSFVQLFFEIFPWLAGLFQPGLLMLVTFAFLVGLRRMPIRNTLLLMSPVLITLLASLLQLYPLLNRLILFFLPGFMLLIGVGLQDIYYHLSRLNHQVAILVMAAIALGFLAQINVTQTPTEIREVLHFIQAYSEQPRILADEAVNYVAAYYQVPTESIEASQKVVDGIGEAAVIWIVLSTNVATWNEAPFLNSLPEADYVYEAHNVVGYCYDGLQEACPSD